MAGSEQAPLDTVGWGPFPLFGERKRMQRAEEQRLAEVANFKETAFDRLKKARSNEVSVSSQAESEGRRFQNESNRFGRAFNRGSLRAGAVDADQLTNLVKTIAN